MNRLEIKKQTTWSQTSADNLNAIVEKIDEIVDWINAQTPHPSKTRTKRNLLAP